MDLTHMKPLLELIEALFSIIILPFLHLFLIANKYIRMYLSLYVAHRFYKYICIIFEQPLPKFEPLFIFEKNSLVLPLL